MSSRVTAIQSDVGFSDKTLVLNIYVALEFEKVFIETPQKI